MKRVVFLLSLAFLTLSCGTQKQAVQTSAGSTKSDALTRVDDRDKAVRSNLPQVGKLMAPFHETGTDGKLWTNHDLEGHVTVFYLWYQGCMDALSEMGELSNWKVMYPDVMYFSVTWHDVGTTNRIANQRHFTWTHLCNARQMMTWVSQGVDEKSANARNYPVTIVVDQQGIVRRVVSGTSMEKRQATLDCIRQYR